MAICKITGLNKTYQNEHSIVNAIVNCNCEIAAGECVAICGTKASGKTTLLRIIGGLERPSSGDVFINYDNIVSYSDDKLAVMRRKEIGYLFHNDTLISELTVHENIIIPALLAGKKYEDTYCRNIIRRLQMKDILSLYPRQLSLNQLQQVICARALINDPDIILVDEPEGYSMDRNIIDFLLDMVYQYHKTLIMVTNDSETCFFADHIIRLHNGEIIEDRRIS